MILLKQKMPKFIHHSIEKSGLSKNKSHICSDPFKYFLVLTTVYSNSSRQDTYTFTILRNNAGDSYQFGKFKKTNCTFLFINFLALDSECCADAHKEVEYRVKVVSYMDFGSKSRYLIVPEIVRYESLLAFGFSLRDHIKKHSF